MKISRNTVATVSYTVTDERGQIVGRTEPNHPVEALIGYRYLVTGLEKALDGHEKGDEFAITLNPHDAYGEFDQNLIQEIPRSMFGDFELEVGSVFEADSDQGPMAVVVKEIRDDVVVVDGNHPLSGKILNFLVVVEDVREATAEEKKHGHVHHDGHCPSEEGGEHHCCCGHHHDHDHDEDGEHHCCCHDHDEVGEHHCCCHDHDHDEDGEHHCCCHDHDEDGEHHCCHHHDHDESHH